MRLSHKIVLTLGICGLGLAGLILALPIGDARNQAEIFPQNQDCQPDSVAIWIRFPYRREGREYVSNLEAKARPVTNCRRMGFQFFFKALEVTTHHFALIGGNIWKKLYGLSRNGEQDLVVHVNHVQPATSLRDPTIQTNLVLSSFAHQLQRAYERFDGNREPLQGYSLDRFRPYDAVLRQYGVQEGKLFFLSRPGAAVELVGQCRPGLGKTSVDSSSWCHVLAYSQQDGLAFGVVLPHAELGRLNDILERTLGLIRSWRVQA